MLDKYSQNIIMTTDKLNEEREYWLKKLQGKISMGEFPTDYQRLKADQYRKMSTSFKFPWKIYQRLASIGKNSEYGIYVILLAGVEYLLHRYTGSQDIIVGMPAPKNTEINADNITALRSQLNNDMTFKELILETKAVVSEAAKYKNIAFDNILKLLDLEDETSFKTLVLLENIHVNLDADDIKVDMNFNFSISENDLEIKIEYNSSLYKHQKVERIIRHILNLFDSVTENLDIRLLDIDILENDADKTIYGLYNATERNIEAGTLHELFTNTVKLVPNKEAIKHHERVITYKELEEKSNQAAKYLLDNSVQRGDYIGVSGKRCIETVVNMLAILKVGAAYIPVDPDYPEERKQYIIENSNCKLFITPDMYQKEAIDQYPSEAVEVKVSTEDTAYIIFTSGSTGKPKGVEITHGAITNTIIDINERFNITKEDRIIGISSMCFDLSVYDIFGALSSGATLVMVDDQRDVFNLIEVIKQEKITIWNSVPAIMGMAVDLKIGRGYEALRLVLLSGDWIPVQLPEKIREVYKNAEVISLGGATEASIWSIYYPINRIEEEWSSIPYGMPLANQKYYVLNNNLQLCPIGVQGELYIGGAGVAKGYINDMEKTQAAFITQPGFGRLYKTGDYGVLKEEGYIEFLGRKDNQVKIRGYRIELGEIENCLIKHEYIKKAVVVDYTDESEVKKLYAYIIHDNDIDFTELRGFLEKTLPDYMVPVRFISIENIPLTANGKVDRSALMKIAKNSVETEYREPATDVEKQIAKIWEEVLEAEKIGLDDNFFNLDGDSLKAVKIMMRAGQQDMHITVMDIFKYRTIASILKNADYNKKEEQVQLEAGGREEGTKYGDIFDGEIKELKIVLQTDITVYLWHSLALCVILTDEKLYPWYYEHFIEIFSMTDEKDYTMLEFLEVRSPYKEILHELCMGYELLEEVSNMVEFVIKRINMGYYVIIHIDEYCLPVKARYKKEHFVRRSMVYGYNSTERKLMAVGFDEHDMFNKISIDYDMFAEAFESGKLYYKETSPWAETNAIELLKPRAFKKDYPFDMGRFLKKLADYTHSKGDYSIIYSLRLDKEMLNEDHIQYGLNVYDAVIRSIENIFEGRNTIDYRSIHLLAEHKKVMLARLQYVISRYNLAGDVAELVGQYQHIVKRLEAVRIRWLAAMYSGDSDITGIQQAKESIASARGDEKVLLTGIYKKLKEKN